MDREQIRRHEFFIGLRSYNREDVDEFLAAVETERRRLLDEIEELRAAATATDLTLAAEAAPAEETLSDERLFEQLGTRIAAILRDAKVTADEIRREAEQFAEAARAEAGCVLAEAERRAGEVEEAAMRRGMERAARAADAAATTAADAVRRCERLREKVREAVDELQLALLALGEPDDDALRRHGELHARLTEASEEAELALVALEQTDPPGLDASANSGVARTTDDPWTGHLEHRV